MGCGSRVSPCSGTPPERFPSSGFRVSIFGLQVLEFRFRVSAFWFRVEGRVLGRRFLHASAHHLKFFGFRSGFQGSGFGFLVSGFWFPVQGLGFEISGFRFPHAAANHLRGQC